MIKRKLFLLGIVGLALLTLAGCGGGGKQQGTPALTFMYWVDSPQAAQDYADWLTEFKTSTQQEVGEMTAPFGSAYDQKLVIMMGAQKAPDLFVLRPDQMQVLIGKHGLLALDDRFRAEGLPHPDQEKYPYVYGSDGKVYGIPVTDEATYVILAKTKQIDQAWELTKFLLKKTGHF